MTSTRGSRAHDVRPTQQSDLIARTADGVVEACCLVAVAMLPLYFPILAGIGPETNKAVILIALTPIAAGAWLAGAAARGMTRVPGLTSKPLIWSGLSVLAAYAIATVFSIHPYISFFGTLTRHQGLLTHIGYAVFFVCAATRLRRHEQIQRLITILLLGSIPAVMYGILQQFGVDPLPSSGDPSALQWPVRSSFGNHVFFGTYLVLMMPLAASRLLEAWLGRAAPPIKRRGKGSSLAPLLVLVPTLLYFGFLAIGRQSDGVFALMPAFLAGYPLFGVALENLPRSPALQWARLGGYAVLLALQGIALVLTSARGALLGALAALFLFALLAAWRLRRPRVSWIILGGAGAVAVLVLVLNIGGGPLQRLREMHAVNRIANIQDYATESSGAGRLLVWQGVATLMTRDPGIGGNWGGPARDIVGYGPESLDAAFEAVFPLKLRVEASENYTWDRAHNIYLDILVDAGALGLVALALTLIFFFVRVIRTIGRPGARMGWLSVGIASAIAGHLAEGVFGVETAASLLIFWIFMGLAASPGMATEVLEDTQQRTVSWAEPTFVYGALLGALIFVVALTGTLTDYPALLATIWLGAMIAGVGAVAWVVTPRAAQAALSSSKGRAPVVLPASTRLRVLVGGLSVLVLVFMAIPWRFQTAASAESAGVSYFFSGQVPQGIAYLQQAAQTDGEQAKYREALAVVYTGLAGANVRSSEPAYVPAGDDARTIDPQQVQTLGRDQLFELGVSSLQAAEALTPLDPAVHASLGDAYLSWGRPAQALQEYRRAERLSHDNPRYVADEALAFVGLDRMRDALSRAQAAVHLDSTFWFSFYVRSGIYDQLDRKTLARSDAKLALVLLRNYVATPPAGQLTELRRLARNG